MTGTVIGALMGILGTLLGVALGAYLMWKIHERQVEHNDTTSTPEALKPTLMAPAALADTPEASAVYKFAEADLVELREQLSAVYKFAEADLVELREQLLGRTLTDSQQDSMIAALAQFGGQGLELEAATGSEEVDRLARQLQSVFESASIEVSLTYSPIFSAARSGIVATVGSNRFDLMEAVANQLLLVGVITAPLPIIRSENPDYLGLSVWPAGQ